MHLEFQSIPIFITEIILFVFFPLLLGNIKRIFKFFSIFFLIVFCYFLLGSIYLIIGISRLNYFACRDFIVLCAYILFFPIPFLCLDNVKSMKLFILAIAAANIVAIAVGRILIFGFQLNGFYDFFSKAKLFQIGIVYGIAVAFFIAFFFYVKNNFVKFLILTLVSINFYMILIFGVRSLWVAVICLMIFLALILEFKLMMKLYFKLAILFIAVSSILFYFDFKFLKSPYLDVALGRAKSVVYVYDKFGEILKGRADYFYNHEKFDLQEKWARVGYDDVVWRMKIWSQTMKFTSGHYLLGKGYGLYPSYDVWGYQNPSSAFVDSNITPVHNEFLTIFYKTGFLGIILFLAINFYVFIFSVRYIKNCNSKFIKLLLSGALGALVFWHTVALFFDVIDSPPTSVLLWIFIGIIFAAIAIDKRLSLNKQKCICGEY
jgi:hypothetical protein